MALSLSRWPLPVAPAHPRTARDGARIFRADRWLLRTTACLILVLAGGTSPAAAQGLALSNGQEDITELAVGDDLLVRLVAIPQHPGLRARLLDDGQQIIAETKFSGQSIDGAGHYLLWRRSGVVGCDPEQRPDPLLSEYRDFALAEANLVGRTFSVVLVDAGEQVLVQIDLPLVAPWAVRFFFSDASGCPRSLYSKRENIFFSALRADPEGLDTAIFLVDKKHEVTVAGEILEVRSTYSSTPQSYGPEKMTGDWTIDLWSRTETMPGSYGAILRNHDGPTGFFLEPGDQGIGALVGVPGFDAKDPDGGITIQNWDCPADC